MTFDEWWNSADADSYRAHMDGLHGEDVRRVWNAGVRSERLELQQQCVEWGAYWRAPDAHGVNLTHEQATELLRRALGVEVEIATPLERAVIQAAQEWSAERTINDWSEADLAKALWALNGDWAGCDNCDHQCGEPCEPTTVAEAHAAIDRRLNKLVAEGKLYRGTPWPAAAAQGPQP